MHAPEVCGGQATHAAELAFAKAAATAKAAARAAGAGGGGPSVVSAQADPDRDDEEADDVLAPLRNVPSLGPLTIIVTLQVFLHHHK